MATALELQHFAVLEVSYFHETTAITITCSTNNPSHLTLFYTDKKPVRHPTTLVKRGVALPWGAYFCFVAWNSVEQQEAGDTLTHTFYFPEWPPCTKIISEWDLPSGLAPPYFEPWGDTLTEHNPWQENGFLFGSKTILASGHCSIFNDGQGGINISVPFPNGNYPLETPARLPLAFAHHATLTDYDETYGWLSYYFETTDGIDSYLIEPLIARGSFWGPWGSYKSASPTVYAFDFGTGPQTLNILEAWKQGRQLAGLSTDPDGWYLKTHRIANEQWIGAAQQTITTDFVNLFYPPTTIITSRGDERYFTFRGTVEGELSPSVTAIMAHCHPGVFPGEVDIRIAHNNDDHRRLNGTYQACPTVCPPILEAGYFYVERKHAGCGMRFLAVPIPRLANILEANLTFTASQDMAGTCRYTRISAEQEDNPPDFSLDDWLSARARWQNSGTAIDWDNIPAWTQNNVYTGPDISLVIQELVNRDLWAPGNAIVLFWNDWDERAGNLPYITRRAYSYNASPARTVKLRIKHEA